MDIVDKEKSSFLTILPLDPPLPTSIRTLRFSRKPEAPPPLLYALIPGTRLTFSELIVRDDFRTAWERAEFTGATFRRLC